MGFEGKRWKRSAIEGLVIHCFALPLVGAVLSRGHNVKQARDNGNLEEEAYTTKGDNEANQKGSQEEEGKEVENTSFGAAFLGMVKETSL